MTGLRELMSDVADQARSYDMVDDAYRLGRRRRLLRRTLTVGTVFAAVLGTVVAINLLTHGRPAALYPAATGEPSAGTEPTAEPSVTRPESPAAPAACDVARLALPAGYPAMSIATAGDPSGRFHVGRAYIGSGERRMLIWDGGSVSTVDMPGGDPTFYDVNGSGEAVGSSYLEEGEVPWVYHDGTLSRLPGGVGVATAVNEDGVIVGAVGPDASHKVPVVWRSPTAQPEPLTLPGDVINGSADGIDDDGTIVGSAGGLVIWRPDGTLVPVPGPVTVHGRRATTVSAIDIRNGWVLGFANVETGGDVDATRFLWDTRTGAVQSLPIDYATTVNAHGWVVGAAGPIDALTDAAMAADGQIVLLPNLPDHTGDIEPQVMSISDDGTVMVGYDFAAPDSENAAAIWHCH